MTTEPLTSGVWLTRVRALRPAAERVLAVELEAADGSALPDWTPGAHVDVTLSPGLVRQYSLCSEPGSSSWRLGVLEEVAGRGGSHHVHHLLREGDELVVSTPRNTFTLELGQRRVLFVAGGIGITPLLPMVHAAAAAGADWQLRYLSRTPGSAAFVDELEPYGGRVQQHADSEAGVLDLAADLDARGGMSADVYVCGPASLLDAVESYAAERPGCKLRVERFAAAAGPPDPALDHGFVVEIADGTQIDVAADQTVLEALSEAGVPVLSSCREGVCGTCETAVIEGAPDHRDHVLSDDEHASGEMMMPCVSRCLGDRLVLDL